VAARAIHSRSDARLRRVFEDGQFLLGAAIPASQQNRNSDPAVVIHNADARLLDRYV
jgi:hypothetical protein